MVEDSATHGCRLCLLFMHGIRQSYPGSSFFGDPFPSSYRHRGMLRAERRQIPADDGKVSKPLSKAEEESEKWPSIWDINLYLPDSVMDPNNMTFSYVVLKPAQATGLSNPRVMRKDNKAFDLLREWLRSCIESHQEFVLAEHVIPTRLIEIGEQCLRLRLTADLGDKPQYTTLSHYWGNVIPFKLLQSNLESLQQSIPTDKLSKTFRDAIEICREIGVRYMWIDSLCIIQDSPSDWAFESALMASVYGCSYLNIVAASATDGNMGCYFDRDPRTVSPSQVLLDPKGKKKLYSCVPGRLYEDCVTNTPLASRVWCLQERFLAHRNVFFSSRQLFWECNELVACETYPGGADYKRDFGTDSWKRWFTLIQSYSEKSLTYSTDRLTALSGIVQYYQNIWRDDYHAGLWREDFEIQLLWATLDRSMPRTTPYIAPSWSWASTNRGIFHPGATKEAKVCLRIEDIEVIPASSDPFGQVKSGTLKIACPRMVCGYPRKFTAFEDGEDSLSDWSPPILGDLWSGRLIYFLPVTEIETDEAVVINGLCIQPTGLEQGQFQRIGIFIANGPKEVKAIKGLGKKGDFLANEKVYAVVAGGNDADMRHRITIA